MDLAINGVLRAAAILGCALIAGCGGGGGGGGGGSTPPPPPPPQNRAPTFGTVQFSTTEDVDVSGQITATDADGDALTFTKTGDPGKGTVTAFAANGSFTYRPTHDAFGSDTFAVRVADSQGSGVNGTVTIQIAGTPDPPAARNDVLTATTASLANINVLANDTNPDGNTLTVTIESPAEVGTATANAGGTIAISGLPAGFRGITRFKYRVTDPSSNAFSVGTAAVFVDVAPFRVVFGGDEQQNGSVEVYLTDLVTPAVKLSAATEGTLRLRNFLVSANGSTVVYRRRDQSNVPTDLTFVRTANPATKVPVQLPVGMQLLHDTINDRDYYVVSPDGQWIGAVVSKSPAGTVAVILLNVANPTQIHTASAPDAINARALQFSIDSQNLYFLAGVPSVGIGFTLFRAAVASPDQSTQVSASPPTLNDDVKSYAVSADQSKILLTASRNSVTNLYYVSSANLRNEIRLNHLLNAGDQLFSTAFQVGTTVGGSPNAARVGYSVQPASGPVQSYIAEVSATPNARPLAPPGLRVDAIRPDNAAALLETETQTGTDVQTFEKVIDSAAPPALVAEGFASPSYDATGDVIFMTIFHDPPQPSRTTAVAFRSTFGASQPVGTAGNRTLLLGMTAADRPIAYFGEVANSSQLYRMALVSAWAPDKLLYLAEFPSKNLSNGGMQAQFVDP